MSKTCTTDLRRVSDLLPPAKSANLHYGVQAVVVALNVDDAIITFKNSDKIGGLD